MEDSWLHLLITYVKIHIRKVMIFDDYKEQIITMQAEFL